MKIIAWKKDNGNGLKYYTISHTCPESGAIKTIIDFNKKIVDCYGVPCLVSDFNRKIIRFDNKKQIITYNAPSIRLEVAHLNKKYMITIIYFRIQIMLEMVLLPV